MKKNKKNSNTFLIGLFVLFGISLLVGFLLWMGATQFFKDYNYYVTYFEESVDGLDKGSSVKYLGVSCGFINEINIAPDGRLVEIVLKLDKELNVGETFVARLESAGITGGKYIQLTAEKNKSKEFDIDFIPPYQVINSATSQLKEITETAESIITNLNEFKWQEISDGLAGTLEGTKRLVENIDISSIISDLKSTTQTLNLLANRLSEMSIDDDLSAISTSVSNTAKALESFSVKLDSKIDSVNVSEYLDKMYNDYYQTFSTVNSAISSISNRLQSSIIGVNILLEDISKTNKNLNKTLRIINESPYIFLTDPPPPDNFK